MTSLHCPSLLRLCIVSTLAFGALPAVAQNDAAATPDDTAATQLRLREELRALMLDLAASGAVDQQRTLEIDEPARRVNDLGLLVDSSSAERARDGLRVLAVTPGGTAERLGVRGGDILVSVNDRSLTRLGADESGQPKAAQLLRDSVSAVPDGDALALGVRRNDRTFAVSGPVASVHVPAVRLTVGAAATAATMTGCGRISVFGSPPRSENLHEAKLVAVDGRLPGPTDATSFRLDPGTHILTVGEGIEARYLSFNERLRNAQSNRYKTLSVEVEPGMTYFLAARLNPEKVTEAKDGAYWDPVIWKEVAESCH
ncbi:MAG TPA: PDZ domain-containing protein [Dokdonella sp.]|uniref:PDZ domain-containing protein n=1 Tax=Dokdonella sp. TaxID=2291710 RepID=UPI002BBF891D|nr:PDZ domain-containing protein [Dokdonella sp.]HUD41905.1 PDZ domain-containing protein [Dokdonella sp.]